MVQFINQPQGDFDPNASMGRGVQSVVDTILALRKHKTERDEQDAQRRLQLWMTTGELTGELEKPTPDVQKAFRKIYKTEPFGIFASGGETMAGKKAKLEIATKAIEMDQNLSSTELNRAKVGEIKEGAKGRALDIKQKQATIKKTYADTGRIQQIKQYYGTRSKLLNITSDKGAMTEAIKFANSKLGKPFMTLTDEERASWDDFYQEGVRNYMAMKGDKGGSSSIDTNKYTPEQQGWLNKWRAKSPGVRQKILQDPGLQSELQRLGISQADLGE